MGAFEEGYYVVPICKLVPRPLCQSKTVVFVQIRYLPEHFCQDHLRQKRCRGSSGRMVDGMDFSCTCRKLCVGIIDLRNPIHTCKSASI